MTFGDRINYITLQHLKESSEHLGGVEEGSTAHLIHKSDFCVSTLRLIEDCWHLTEKPEKPPRGQEFCCCIFFTSLLLIVIQSNFWKTKPKCILKFGCVFITSENKLALSHCLTGDHNLSEMFHFSEEYSKYQCFQISQVLY